MRLLFFGLIISLGLWGVPPQAQALNIQKNKVQLQSLIQPADTNQVLNRISKYDEYMKTGYLATKNRSYQSALINFRKALKERPNDAYAIQAIQNVENYIDSKVNNQIKTWATVAVMIALCIFWFNAQANYSNTKLNRASLWLNLREMFDKYDDIYVKLRPEGAWHNGKDGHPKTVPEWMKVEAYMALFEDCKYMIDNNILDWHTFNNIYKYRIENILDNPHIVCEQLIKRKAGWNKFLELVGKLKEIESLDKVDKYLRNELEKKHYICSEHPTETLSAHRERIITIPKITVPKQENCMLMLKSFIDKLLG
ncbi:MAG: hypothetical protein IGS49_09685 [Chlorogloeopsis fritschii C42_A2020_084]|uniref:hypothetical protein n=1 Tax=Chlorogloeopsis fritschii TaxID=1124 RepID=UPI001A06E612|nr:hypothetical protein [Chlorogloeopsis fritschii]MBF2005716.1 hypothetical protein [Chlorogloeopsis fritschii C42_A2020_084]